MENTKRFLSAVGVGLLGLFSLATYDSSSAGNKFSSGDPLGWPRDVLLDHARGIFRQLTFGDLPAWEHQEMGWRDQCDVGLTEGRCSTAEPVNHPEPSTQGHIAAAATSPENPVADFHFWHSLTEPSELRIAESTTPGSAQPVRQPSPALFQTIYYNGSAAATIGMNNLGDPNALNDRLSNLKKEARSLQDMRVADFAPDAVVVKTFWEIVRPVDFHDNSASLAGGSDLFHEDLNPRNNGTYRAFSDFSQGNYKSYIDISDAVENREHCKRTTISHDENGKEGKFSVYSLGCFHSREITRDDVNNYARSIVQSDFAQSPNCFLRPTQHCYLLLVGVHVMTRETPNWVWMTYWWSSAWWARNPGIAGVQNKWDLFEVNATVNNTDPVANPYLEGTGTGMQSNCMECHRHAVFHPGFGSPIGTNTALSRYTSGIAGTDLEKPSPLSFAGQKPIDGVYTALAPGKIDARLRDLQTPSCFFAEALQTHFLWTIALHASSETPKDPCPPQVSGTGKNPPPK